MSARMMATIASLVPAVEVYSIDECFADLSGLNNLTALGLQIRERVGQWVGIPACVGIAPTKTLAKYCNHLAKKFPALHGVLNWNDLSAVRQNNALACQGVGEIWGIGAQLSNRLKKLGINTPLDLSQASEDFLKQCFPINVIETARELRGVEAIEFEPTAAVRQRVVRSRSFANDVYDRDDLLSAITMHAEEAAREFFHLPGIARAHRVEKDRRIARRTERHDRQGDIRPIQERGEPPGRPALLY